MGIFDKRRKEKLKEKEMLAKIKQEEEEIEKEINEVMPEPKFSLKESFELLKNQDEEEAEYESYLTEEELEEEKSRKQEEKKIIKTAAVVMVTVVIITIVGVRFFYDTFKGDLLKVTEPMLKSHYETVTGEKAKTKSIEELMTKNEDKKDVGTGIYLLTTEDGKHVMSVNNSLVGDDININNKKEDVKKYIRPYLGDLVIDSLSLSYDEYYVSYNRFLDYINVLPSGKTTEELISSNKLTVTYKAIYQGDLDIDGLASFIETLSPNSKLFLIKQASWGISRVTLIDKEGVLALNVTTEIEKGDGIVNLELDRSLNSVVDTDVSLYASSSVSSKYDYNIINPISIKAEKNRYNKDDYRTNYYLIRVPSSLITEDGFVELSTSKREDTYQEIEKENYKDVFLLTIGSYTYIFGENDIFIGQKNGKKNSLCKFGIC